jgi:uroporphyrinogen III methyltransferase/synthase
LEGRVYLVGAGPGSPDLLTLRAVELLQQADVILYDQLVPVRLLDWANPKAERICVGDLPGKHADKAEQLHQRMVAAARQGRRVVRLKGGDPLIFGRGGEEIAALRAAGVPYEVVPGVTAALAAGAYLEIPLTHRHYASALALVTGHEAPDKAETPINWRALAQFPGTLAIYMGLCRLPQIVAALLEHGLSPDTPAAVISRASWGTQRSVFARLAELDQARRQAGLESPAVILIGPAVGQRTPQPWSEQRPLFGQSVLVTRPRHQAAGLIRRLEQLGAIVHHWPALAIREPEDSAELDAALAGLAQGRWDWLVFTSVNGVHGLLRRLWQKGGDLRTLSKVQLAAIGPKTAEALHAYHLRADLVPERTFSSEGLAAALGPRVAGQRVLLARADRGRELLSEELRRWAAEVRQVTVYRQVEDEPPSPELLQALRQGTIRWITLTSSNIARRVLAFCDSVIRQRILQGEIGLVAISPETGSVVRAAGLPVAAEAEVYTEEGLIAALIDCVQPRRKAPASSPAIMPSEPGAENPRKEEE